MKREPSEIGALIKNEDNHATSYPIFVVQTRERIYGIDSRWIEKGLREDGSGFDWVYEDGLEPVDAENTIQLESKFEEDGEDEPPGYRRICYVDRWEWVQPFFTKSGAQDYIVSNAHNLKNPRIYVESAHRNYEWQVARSVFLCESKFVRTIISKEIE